MEKFEAQARICPICIDDHSDRVPCSWEDLRERVRNLSAEVKELQKFDRNLALCALGNFENFERAFPPALKHPYYLIAKAQFLEALGIQTVEESLALDPKHYEGRN